MKNSTAQIEEEKRGKIKNECRHDSTFENKIQDVSSRLKLELSKLLYNISEDNALTIGNYIQALRIEVNPSDHYISDVIRLQCTFSKSNGNLPFNAISREDIISFLESYRKPETLDPMHRWIGTYNI